MKPYGLALVGAWLLTAFSPMGQTAMAETETESQVLFVQSAGAMTYEGDQLTLTGIAPHTLYFSDRPERFAGSIGNEAFVEHWNQGADSFANDPPNAAITFDPESKQQPAVLELTGIKLEGGDTLVYSVKILDGSLPASSGPVALFIDNHRWGGTGLMPDVDPATDPELGFGTTFGPNWGPAFANASEPEDLRGQGPGGAGAPASASCGSHSLLSFHICF
ncbi:MAG: hypothetical protein AAFY02_15245 [Pseudomonadota bacterium]